MSAAVNFHLCAQESFDITVGSQVPSWDESTVVWDKVVVVCRGIFQKEGICSPGSDHCAVLVGDQSGDGPV
jgi:hypothetical protein